MGTIQSFFISVFCLLLGSGAWADDKALSARMGSAVGEFLKTLNTRQRQQAVTSFKDTIRFDWHYVPRDRKGLSLHDMNAQQREKAFVMLKIVLSAEGYQKTQDIIALENVLRVVENRPPNDTYRDPENYSFMIFGEPDQTKPWGWRLEGHHISLQFTFVDGQIAFTPGFMGANPGQVLQEVPQKGKRVLADETDLAFQLLNSFSGQQLQTVLLSEKAPWEILSQNKMPGKVDVLPQGMAMKDMTQTQKTLFLELIKVYLGRYHITLKNQQLDKLKLSGLDGIHFAWMGQKIPEIKEGAGYYYRIQGPTILIEYDNTQNNANHIHTVVRDLTNDFGEDLLRLHYEKQHLDH